MLPPCPLPPPTLLPISPPLPCATPRVFDSIVYPPPRMTHMYLVSPLSHSWGHKVRCEGLGLRVLGFRVNI